MTTNQAEPDSDQPAQLTSLMFTDDFTKVKYTLERDGGEVYLRGTVTRDSGDEQLKVELPTCRIDDPEEMETVITFFFDALAAQGEEELAAALKRRRREPEVAYLNLPEPLTEPFVFFVGPRRRIRDSRAFGREAGGSFYVPTLIAHRAECPSLVGKSRSVVDYGLKHKGRWASVIHYVVDGTAPDVSCKKCAPLGDEGRKIDFELTWSYWRHPSETRPAMTPELWKELAERITALAADLD